MNFSETERKAWRQRARDHHDALLGDLYRPTKAELRAEFARAAANTAAMPIEPLTPANVAGGKFCLEPGTYPGKLVRGEPDLGPAP